MYYIECITFELVIIKKLHTWHDNIKFFYTFNVSKFNYNNKIKKLKIIKKS